MLYNQWWSGLSHSCDLMKYQDLHDTEQQDIQEEPQWEPIIGGLAETTGLESDQWFAAMKS